MIAILFALGASAALTSCPKPQEIQSEFVKNHFDIEKFAPSTGSKLYYELAYKDITQPRFCKCITAEKSYLPAAKQIKDKFSIECVGKPFTSDLRFNLTETPGVYTGIWNQAGVPILSKLRFPDSVVDVGVNANGSYDWVVEFQCIEGLGKVLFYAFNFYSSTNTPEFYQPMLNAFIKAGLDNFLNDGRKIHLVDHTGCTYAK